MDGASPHLHAHTLASHSHTHVLPGSQLGATPAGRQRQLTRVDHSDHRLQVGNLVKAHVDRTTGALPGARGHLVGRRALQRVQRACGRQQRVSRCPCWIAELAGVGVAVAGG